MSSKTIVVVEDDDSIALGLEDTLRVKGYAVLVTRTGSDAVETVRQHSPDLVILDVMLPDFDGFEVCRRIKGLDGPAANTPIIMLTARGAELDRVRGLELGADDYVTKPFSLMELLARVAAVLRRSQPQASAPEQCSFGDVDVDFGSGEVRKGGALVPLPHRALAILRVLAARPGEIVSREELLNGAWGYDKYPNTRTVDNHVVKLRKALEDEPDKPKHLLTVHGAGYRLKL